MPTLIYNVRTKKLPLLHDVPDVFGRVEQTEPQASVLVAKGTEVKVFGLIERRFAIADIVLGGKKTAIVLTAYEIGHANFLAMYQKSFEEFLCPKCEGDGHRHVEEDGRDYQDPCYRCGTTGWVDAENHLHYRIERLCSVLAGDMLHKKKRAANSNPDGEGWDFHAAENGMRGYDYDQHVHMGLTDRVSRALSPMLADERREVLIALMERLDSAVASDEGVLYGPTLADKFVRTNAPFHPDEREYQLNEAGMIDMAEYSSDPGPDVDPPVVIRPTPPPAETDGDDKIPF